MSELLPPQEPLAERSVLGSVMLSGKALEEVSDVLRGGEFYSPAHEEIFAAAQALRSRKQPVDAVSVSSELARMKTLEKVGGSAFIHQLTTDVPTAASAGYYAGLVAEAASKRRLIQAGQKIAQLGFDAEVSAMEGADAAFAALADVPQVEREAPRFLDELLEEAIDSIGKKVRLVPTPWSEVNQNIGGLGPGRLYVVAARPGVGKSVVAAMLAKSLAGTGSVAWISLEMSEVESTLRLIASEATVNIGRLGSSEAMTDEDWRQVADARSRMAGGSISISGSEARTMADLKAYVRSVAKSRAPLSGIIVDYMQLMTQDRGDNRPRHEFVADVSRQLKMLAREMSVPVVALAQLNRNSESRSDKMPQLSDLRESGAVEQDADVVILMQRELTGDLKNNLNLVIAKNRHGTTGTIELQFWGQYSAALEGHQGPNDAKAFITEPTK